MKIDIEGFEPYAFEHSKRLLAALDIVFIFMEYVFMHANGMVYWPSIKNVTSKSDLSNEIENMVNTLLEFKYTPYADIEAKKQLDPKNRNGWPWGIFWIKNTYQA